MLITKLAERGVITPPRWLPNAVQYLTIMGSVAYGVSSDTSDMDLYGFCIPPKEVTFPHLAGIIPGFGDQGTKFDQWQEHHVPNPDGKKIEYDFAIFSITKFFQLCMDNNPNMLNSLFVPRVCILHSTQVSEMVRDRRREFLHRGCWPKFKGYAYGQMNKIKNKTQANSPARAASIEKHGYDLKYALHSVRLLNEVEQILVEGDLDIQRNREQLKSIRRGEWTFEEFQSYFAEKERHLETAYANTKLPMGPDEPKIKALLMSCLEHHYGTISKVISRDAGTASLVSEIEKLMEKYK